jgi:hypothetical protein
LNSPLVRVERSKSHELNEPKEESEIMDLLLLLIIVLVVISVAGGALVNPFVLLLLLLALILFLGPYRGRGARL